MDRIILSKQDKTELDYALSTSIGGAVFESILVGFIKQHINKDFRTKQLPLQVSTN